MYDEESNNNWIMMLSFAKKIVEKSETREEALEELDRIIQEIESLLGLKKS